MDEFVVKPSALETVDPKYPFLYDRARQFQSEVLEWIHGNGPRLAAVDAPTGAGKTAAFAEVVRNSGTSLIIYPTNALMAQQRTVLEEHEISVGIVNADSLQQRGPARIEELLQYAQNPPIDAVLTNPDILQAVLQDMYTAVGQEMRFFEGFDSIIYDEFHFYDPLAASGLLLQIDIISRRSPNTDILLTSATPDESFLNYIDSYLDLDLQTIRAKYADPASQNADQFRFETTVHRHGAQLRDSFEEAASILASRVATIESLEEPHAAIIFNSAAVSNRFHEYVFAEYPDLYEVMRKDNGYDTKSDHEASEDFAALNTTSKGEVGLHFDLDLLLMQNPRSAASFLQRFGRAGRESPATVHVYGLGDLSWPASVSFEALVDRSYDVLPAPQMNRDRIRNLIGLRAAQAVKSRADSGWLTDEIYTDFETVGEYERWRRVLESIDDEQNAERGPLGPHLDRNEQSALEIAAATIDGLRTLRGQTLDATITYPRGDSEVTTSYDLLSSLREYGLDRVTDDSTLVLGGEPHGLLVDYPGYQDAIDYEQSHQSIERELTSKATELLEGEEFVASGLQHTQLGNFFRTVPLSKLLLPQRIRSGAFEITFQNGSIESVTIG